MLQKLRYVKSDLEGHAFARTGDDREVERHSDGVAHAFFPENLRKSKPVYHGKNIFAIEGVELLNADMDAVFNAFTGKYMT